MQRAEAARTATRSRFRSITLKVWDLKEERREMSDQQQKDEPFVTLLRLETKNMIKKRSETILFAIKSFYYNDNCLLPFFIT